MPSGWRHHGTACGTPGLLDIIHGKRPAHNLLMWGCSQLCMPFMWITGYGVETCTLCCRCWLQCSPGRSCRLCWPGWSGGVRSWGGSPAWGHLAGRQLQGNVQAAYSACGCQRRKRLPVPGLCRSAWEVLDFGDVIVHVMTAEQVILLTQQVALPATATAHAAPPDLFPPVVTTEGVLRPGELLWSGGGGAGAFHAGGAGAGAQLDSAILSSSSSLQLLCCTGCLQTHAPER